MSGPTKISSLTSASTLTGAEQVPMVQSSATVRGLVSAIATYVRTIFTTTPLTVAEGGTGSATAVAARTALGAAKSVILAPGDLEVGGAGGAEVRKSIGIFGQVLTPNTNVADGLSWLFPGYQFINASLAASVSGKALTITLKDFNGNALSSSSPAYVTFRDVTITIGAPSLQAAIAPITLTISNGSTLGFAAGAAGRIRVGLMRNGTDLELVAWNPKVGTGSALSVFSPTEDVLVTTTAEGGAGAADSAGVLYSTTARAGFAFRHVGYIDITTGAVAGEWDNAPTKVQTHSPGCKLPGAIVQTSTVSTGALQSGGTALPYDDTIPTNAEGHALGNVLDAAITPSSAANLLRCNLQMNGASNGGAVIGALYQDAGAAIAVSVSNGSANIPVRVIIDYRQVAGTTSATTFKFRAGNAAGDVITLNGAAAARLFGGVMLSSHTIEEIQT